MGVLKRCWQGVLVIGFTLFATGDGETTNTDDAKSKEEASRVTQTTKNDVKDAKVGKPTVKRDTEAKKEPLEPLVLNEKIEGGANIALPQDI